MAIRTGAEPRWAAAQAVHAVLVAGQALDQALVERLQAFDQPRDRALARRLAHQVMREWPQLEALVNSLLKRPPARRDQWVLHLLAVAVAELRDGREPAHAVVHAAVEACRVGGAKHMAGLCNAVLRRFQRERETLEAALPQTPAMQWGYPQWWVQRLQADWPEDWSAILQAGNVAPELTLRINSRRTTVDAIEVALAELKVATRRVPGVPDALQLSQRLAIRDLPGWDQGAVSVQDGSAQHVIELMALQDGQRVLDACAAPGGKTAHMLERADVAVTALDVEAERLADVAQNLDRLGLTATLHCADASRTDLWWDGQPYDRILLDAPCSASGVIRRHPDIRWLRRPQDLPALVSTQAALLDAVWPLLKPGGILVYSTCSVLAQENHEQIHAFLQRHPDGRARPPLAQGSASVQRRVALGQQWLPGELGMDGFYSVAIERLPTADSDAAHPDTD
jgi:16S rRNA (cytosine967-C5)-methyltransferase